VALSTPKSTLFPESAVTARRSAQLLSRLCRNLLLYCHWFCIWTIANSSSVNFLYLSSFLFCFQLLCCRNFLSHYLVCTAAHVSVVSVSVVLTDWLLVSSFNSLSVIDGSCLLSAFFTFWLLSVVNVGFDCYVNFDDLRCWLNPECSWYVTNNYVLYWCFHTQNLGCARLPVIQFNLCCGISLFHWQAYTIRMTPIICLRFTSDDFTMHIVCPLSLITDAAVPFIWPVTTTIGCLCLPLSIWTHHFSYYR